MRTDTFGTKYKLIYYLVSCPEDGDYLKTIDELLMKTNESLMEAEQATILDKFENEGSDVHNTLRPLGNSS
jgi:hypothetical protein